MQATILKWSCMKIAIYYIKFQIVKLDINEIGQ